MMNGGHQKVMSVRLLELVIFSKTAALKALLVPLYLCMDALLFSGSKNKY
jgi:hypothetical protein